MPSRSRSTSPASSISDSELLDGLQDAHADVSNSRTANFDYSSFRAQRLAEIQDALEQARMLSEGRTGRLVDMREERELIETSAKAKFCLIHFYKNDFNRCRIMDLQLSVLAPKHPHTLFLKTSVENAPFLVHRLDVKVLPCVICFVDGNAVDRLIGFEELGNDDNFTAAALEFRLKKSGVLPPPGYRPPTINLLAVRGVDDEDERNRDAAGRDRVVGTIRQGGARRRGVDSDDDEYA